MTPPLSKQQLAEIRSVDLLALMSDRAAGQISGYLVALLAEVERLRTCATGAWRRIDDTLNYLASRDTTDWTANALGLGLDIVAHLDTAPHPDEDVPARPALPWSAFLTDVEAGCLVEELASLFLDYWRGDRAADTATLREVEQLLVKHRDGSQAAEAAGKDTRGGGQPSAGESTQPALPQVWQVFEEDTPVVGPQAALYATFDAARTGTIARYEAMEGVYPDYSWRPHEDGAHELLAGGEPVGIYMAPVRVHGGPDDEPVPCALTEQNAAVAGFFQRGHAYTRQHHGHEIQFRVEHVATPPGGTDPIASGWRTEPCLGGWAPEDSDDIEGWTEVREAPGDRFPYLGTEAGETR